MIGYSLILSTILAASSTAGEGNLNEQFAWKRVECEATYVFQLARQELAFYNLAVCESDPLSLGCSEWKNQLERETQRTNSTKSLCDKL